MGDYPTKRGYYFRDGKWHPSKATKRERARKKLVKEISEQILLYPEKYPYQSFAMSQSSAKKLGYDVWWQKCKKGHLTERKVSESSCPVCTRISKDIRKKRIRDGMVKLSVEEEVRLHEIYREAQKITLETGIEHHVDHIRPLAAGGVHHPDNLQIITAKENLAKSSIYEGRKLSYSKKEKREAQSEFLRKKRQEDEDAKAALREEAETKLAQERQEERKNLLIFAFVAAIALSIFLLV